MRRWNCVEWPCAASARTAESRGVADHRRGVARRPRRRRHRRRGDRRNRPARKLILSALNSGKSVVTANKALLADHTGELAEAAEATGVDLYFEAAVAGAIPVIRPLTQSLAGDRVNKVAGIVNGTTNFILSAMDETGADYAETLAEAGRLGYAEADPTADVEGYDAAAKAAILASIAFHTRVTAADVYREGISKITSADLASARHSTARSSCSRSASESSRPRARNGSPRGSTRRSFRSTPAGLGQRRIQRRRRGSGERRPPHVLRAGRRRRPHRFGRDGRPGDGRAQQGSRWPRHPANPSTPSCKIAPIGDIPTRYYVNMQVADKAACCPRSPPSSRKHGVSISTVRQEGAGDGARLVVVTHRSNRRGSVRNRCGPQQTRIRHRCDQRAATGRH